MLPAWGAGVSVAPPQRLAAGVYAVIGQNADPSPANHGVVGNQGILIGDDGVILVDTGTSARYATQLVEAVRKLTPKPIVLAINTHQNPAFIFGNGTLASQGVPLLAHRDVAELIKQRCEQCLKNLNTILGDDEMRGTRVMAPTRTVDAAMTMTVAGRVLDIIYYGHSSSPGSIGVIDRASGVLFAGGLVSIDRVPDTTAARIGIWLDALEDLKRRSLQIMVPGQGPVAPVIRVNELARYLKALQSTVRRVYATGTSLSDAAKQAALPQFEQWPVYYPTHNRNVQQLYLLLEREALDSP